MLLVLAGCRPDPAMLVPSLLEPATANAQYFHGNCFAGFSVGAALRVQETRGIDVVLSRLDYQIADRGPYLRLSRSSRGATLAFP
jgi:hypothetical protein